MFLYVLLLILLLLHHFMAFEYLYGPKDIMEMVPKVLYT